MCGMTPPPAMVACRETGQSRFCKGACGGLALRGWNCAPQVVGVHVHRHTIAANIYLDERVQLLVTTDGKLQMPGRDTLHLQATGEPISGQRSLLTLQPANNMCCQLSQKRRWRRAFRSLEALPASSSTSAVRYSAGVPNVQVSLAAVEPSSAKTALLKSQLATQVGNPSAASRAGPTDGAAQQEIQKQGKRARTQDGRAVHGCCGSNTTVGGHPALHTAFTRESGLAGCLTKSGPADHQPPTPGSAGCSP